MMTNLNEMKKGNKDEKFGILLGEYKELNGLLKTKNGNPFDLIEAILSGTISEVEIEERCQMENMILDKMDKLRCQMNGIIKEKEV